MNYSKALAFVSVFTIVGLIGPTSITGALDCPPPDGCPPGPTVLPADYIQQHIAVNNVWYSYLDDLCPYGAQNGVVNITGHWLCAGNNPNNPCPGVSYPPNATQCDKVHTFVGVTREKLESRIQQYVSNFQHLPNAVTPSTDGIIVLDMEHPVHPRNLWQYCSGETHDGCIDPRDIVDAWKLRISVVKAAFPNAKIAMYGTLNPHGQGNCGTSYQKRLATLIQAGEWGLYDDLDYLVPVLYNRFGPSDTGQGCPNAWHTYAAYAQQGIDGANALRDSAANPSKLSILPFLNMRVGNGNSCDHGKIILDLNHSDPIGETVLTIIDVLRENGITEFAIWHGSNQQLIGGNNPNGWTISDFFCRAFCTADFNHDGVIDGVDESVFRSLFIVGDMRADLNCDGVLDNDDIDLFYDYMQNGCPACPP